MDALTTQGKIMALAVCSYRRVKDIKNPLLLLPAAAISLLPLRWEGNAWSLGFPSLNMPASASELAQRGK